MNILFITFFCRAVHFGCVHGNAEGQVKKNGTEIHPVIKIEFLY